MPAAAEAAVPGQDSAWAAVSPAVEAAERAVREEAPADRVAETRVAPEGDLRELTQEICGARRGRVAVPEALVVAVLVSAAEVALVDPGAALAAVPLAAEASPAPALRVAVGAELARLPALLRPAALRASG
jgi:hypothetical protein